MATCAVVHEEIAMAFVERHAYAMERDAGEVPIVAIGDRRATFGCVIREPGYVAIA
jgi:hypothetical protein